MDFPSKAITLLNGRAVTLRSVAPADAPQMLEFNRALSHESAAYMIREPHEMDATPERTARRAAEHLTHPAKLWLGAFCDLDNSLVGAARLAAHDLARLSHVATFSIALRVDTRGVGLGRRMLQEAIEWAIANPTIRKISLGVMVSNHRAIRLYEQAGFVIEGHRIGEIRVRPGVFEDDLAMALSVKPT